jgi:hypothetical protein
MTSSAELLQRTGDLIDRSLSQRFHVSQDTGLLTLDPTLADRVLGTLHETIELLRAVTHYFDDGASLPPSASGLSTQDVADLAFVGRTEIVEIRESLQGAKERRNTWKIASEADRAVSRATRSLVSLEASLTELLGLPARERRWFDLGDALEIRRQYVRLWLEVVRAGNPEKGAVTPLLKRFSDQIAILRREKIYPFLRIDDRLELRQLQKRIFALLEDPGPDPEQAALRLWQDLSAYIHLLMQVSRREELREHDRIVIGRVYREVVDADAKSALLSAENHQNLLELAALDPELDRLLLQPSPGKALDYKAPVGRVRAMLWGE